MLSLILSIAVVHTLAVISPGPDFIMVVKNSISRGKLSGIMTTVGISIALLIHITYCAIGIGILISQSIIAFTILKILGAFYLMYLGWKLWKAKTSGTEVITSKKKEQVSLKKSFWEGFMCNVLNPKATLYFVSLFALIIPADMPLSWIFWISLEIIIITFTWFTLVSLFFSLPSIQAKFSKMEKWINKTLGFIFFFFAIKILKATG